MVKFTLLICVYAKDNPEHLRKCLSSVGALSLFPDEIVIVKDGPLPETLEEVILVFQKNGHCPDAPRVSLASETFEPNPTPRHLNNNHSADYSLNIISLPENVTLGPARAAGINAAKNEWVAIMDSDDICHPDRFEKQIKMIEENPNLGLIGGQIAEFTDTPDNKVSKRIVPLTHDDIVRYVKKRTPFNHMTVMLRREDVLKAGNYRLFPWMEDYDLWTRMIKNGTICANSPDVLVDARVDINTFKRRRGIKYIRSEWRLQKQLKTLGFTGTAGFLRNVIFRIPVRLLPGSLIAFVYRRFAR